MPKGSGISFSFSLWFCPKALCNLGSAAPEAWEGRGGDFYWHIQKGGILVGAIILFLSEHKKHDSVLNLSPTPAFSSSVDIAFIVSLINVIIIILSHPKKPSLRQA